MSYVNALYHVVICTKYRRKTINPVYEEDLYRFLWKMIEKDNCKLLRIGGIENHIHMLYDGVIRFDAKHKEIKQCLDEIQ